VGVPPPWWWEADDETLATLLELMQKRHERSNPKGKKRKA
jgi:hypothetical protein